MGASAHRPATCERARAWASLSLDAELSPFERTLLDAHLERCPACAAFAADVRGITAGLRAAEPVRPDVALAPRLPARRRVQLRAFQAGAAAALVAAAVGLAGLVAGSSSAPLGTTAADAQAPIGPQLAMTDDVNDRLLRRIQLQSLKPEPQLDVRDRVLQIPL
jgi:predicted anti-sigma-YlaC factor YlaD